MALYSLSPIDKRREATGWHAYRDGRRNAELEALRRAPAPSEDIEARVRDYVRGLAPKVRGVGVGERLSIVWPGAQSPSGYISEHTCDPLALLAALFPDRMLSLVMTRMANDPLPVAQRAPRSPR